MSADDAGLPGGYPKSTGPGDRDQEEANRAPARSPAELAREALRQAKADARRRGFRRVAKAGTRVREPRPRGGSADPLPLRAAIEELVDAHGWRTQASAAGIFARWGEVVGPQVAAHTEPDDYDGEELVVAADSPAWAAQVRLLAPTLVRRLCEELGDGAVRRVRVRGPTGRGRRGILRGRGSRLT